MSIIEEKLSRLPISPGCYLHKNNNGEVIYVGKAKNLRNRVRSYFYESRNHDIKTQELVSHITDFEYIVTDTELEALVLESNLIKQYKPRYNVLLKDDKQYLHLKLTINEKFPRLIKTRRVLDDGALYFGPYLPASLAQQILKLVNQLFQLRTCEIEIDGKRDRPCLEYHIKRCLGPCVKELCGKTEYNESVKDVRLFFEGKNKDLVSSLQERMEIAAEELRYEQAARYRDQIKVVERLSEEQKVMLNSVTDIDIFGYYREGALAVLQLFTMREGRIIGHREFFWEDLVDFDPSTFIGDALRQYYGIGNYVPNEVHVPVDFEDRELLEEFLTSKKSKRVYIYFPQQGRKRDLIDLVEKNAKIAFEQRFRVLKPDMQNVLEELADTLELPRFPLRIECFDISHIQGAETVASMVVCENGQMKKSDYRKFKIKSVVGIDDFASMNEVVKRRYSHLLRSKKEMPDLVLIDGGKGQLSAAAGAMTEIGLEAIPMAALAKREETLFVKGRESNPINIDHGSPVLHLVQTIRDEAHRFAVEYHRKRREIRDFDSEILKIPGVGQKLKNRLLRNLGSLENIKRASITELTPFVGPKKAAQIVDYFEGKHNKNVLAK